MLSAGQGLNNTEIASLLGIEVKSACKWRSRFGVHGLVDEPRPGPSRSISDEQVEEVIVKTLESTPKDATHWSTRSLAVTQSAVHRIWRAFGLQPHRQESRKLAKTLFVAEPHRAHPPRPSPSAAGAELPARRSTAGRR
jgi:transposase